MNLRWSDVVISIVIVAIIALIVAPLPLAIMDMMLILSFTISFIILITAISARKALDFSIFPTLLLITTLFRLGLTVSTTRLILGNGGDAGNVIHTFANFVTGSNLVVGVIIFIIIVIIQFIVITKGAERVSEVSARFTLDAMPGKQMAIDADLNSGLIDEQQATARRKEITNEADFYGAMDGASKFVKGDAIVGILVVFVNIIGGLISGVTMFGMEIADAAQIYVLATIGDGLTSQIPALIVSVSMGILVTRSDSEGTLGGDFFAQLFAKPMTLYVVAGILVAFSFLPGMPKLVIYIVAAGLIALGYVVGRKANEEPEEEEIDESAAIAEEKRKPENVSTLLQVYPMEVELGYALLPMIDTSQGGDMYDRVVMIRRQCALDLGVIVPAIRLRDNIRIRANEYLFKIKGVEVARGEVMNDHYLALNPGGAAPPIPGIEAVDPAFGLPALWITEKERERAELLGYTTIDAPSVIATHLTEIIKRHCHELLNRQQVQTLLENLKQTQPALVEEVIPKAMSLGELQKVLAGLLRENIPIRDLGTVLETLGDYANVTHDAALLVEYVRQALARTISRRFVPDNVAHVITLDAQLERLIGERVRPGDGGTHVAMEPENTQRIMLALKACIERMTGLGMTPIVLTSPGVRRYFKRLVEPMAPDLVVLSYNELEPDIEIRSDGLVSI